ncbi:MAG: hypothetical protein HOL61_00760 [Rhodospirillaceae bacterium]|jgi:hypothetical protein|nr:hypothetical protein [Rhodospirillaceae bacterium]
MRYWLIGSGSEKTRWSSWRKNKKISIGFNVKKSLRNLDKSQIESYLRQVSRDSRANVDACFDFTHSMAVGDVVVIREGLREIVGVCRISGNYVYDKSLKDYRNVRKVEWVSIERVRNQDRTLLPQQTLLNFTDKENRTWLRNYVDESIDFNQRIVWKIDPPEPTNYTSTRTNQLEGYVYVIGLDAYPGKFKIGHANDVVRRIRELGVSVPAPFIVQHYVFFGDSAWAEKQMHQLLSKNRIRGEWFDAPLKTIISNLTKLSERG